MRYFIDTEFNGYRGALISMALVREDGRSIYFVIADYQYPDGGPPVDPWVAEHVLPILRDCPEPPLFLSMRDAAGYVQGFLAEDEDPLIVADWPDDLRHFCDLVVFGPGEMIGLAALRMEVRRVDAYPTVNPDAVQHNAWWDAVALKEKIEAGEVAEDGPGRRPFAPGDTAMLATGSVGLLVEHPERMEGLLPMVAVVWIAENGTCHRDVFPASGLKRLSTAPVL